MNVRITCRYGNIFIMIEFSKLYFIEIILGVGTSVKNTDEVTSLPPHIIENKNGYYTSKCTGQFVVGLMFCLPTSQNREKICTRFCIMPGQFSGVDDGQEFCLG